MMERDTPPLSPNAFRSFPHSKGALRQLFSKADSSACVMEFKSSTVKLHLKTPTSYTGKIYSGGEMAKMPGQKCGREAQMNT